MFRLPTRRRAATDARHQSARVEQQVVSPVAPSPLGRRLLSLLYDALLLSAVLWCAALPLALLEGELGLPHVRPLFQLYIVTVAGLYFTWQWVRSGQTLAMKTWRLRLVSSEGLGVTWRQAGVRYLAALAGAAFFGITFLWALFDREGLYLHDRIAGTTIVDLRTE